MIGAPIEVARVAAPGSDVSRGLHEVEPGHRVCLQQMEPGHRVCPEAGSAVSWGGGGIQERISAA